MPSLDEKEQVPIDPTVLSLTNSLDKLKCNGGEYRIKSSNLRLKAGGQDASGRRPELTAEELRATLEQIQALKRTKHALVAFTKNLEYAIESQCEDVLPFTRQYGLASLPNELVLHIFRQLLHSAQADSCHFYAARHIISVVSLVSHYFRDIILSLSEAWSYIDIDCMSNSSVNLFLLRSTNERLSIRFTYLDGIKQAILSALEHKRRWVHLDASFVNGQKGIIDDHPPTVFPLVRRLRLRINRNYFDRDAIFSHWSFPCAEDVDLGGDIPWHAASIDRKVLKSFLYETNCVDQDGGGAFLSRLFDFMRPAFALQSLHLSLAHVRLAEYIIAVQPVELPGVTRFSITNWRQDRDAYATEDPPMHLQTYARITSLLVLPNVRELSVSVAYWEWYSDLAYWLSQAFPSSRGLGTVGDLSYNILWLRKKGNILRSNLSLDILFQRFPSIGSLSLDAPLCDIFLSDSYTSSSLVRLQSFALKNYDASVDGLKRLLKCLHTAGSVLERFTIRSNCVLNETMLKIHYPNAAIEMAGQ